LTITQKKQLLQEGKRIVEKVQVPKRVLNESKYERIDYECLAGMDLWSLARVKNGIVFDSIGIGQYTRKASNLHRSSLTRHIEGT
jgi:hypothetical protein